jgi:hypothetical protein
MLTIHNVQQKLEDGSVNPEWLRLRQGIITASEITAIIKMDGTARDAKTRITYMCRLIGEKYTELTDGTGYTSEMERGNRLEDSVVSFLKVERGYDIDHVGFITNTFGEKQYTAGYSPDGLVGDKGCIEAKTHKASLQVYQLLDAYFRRNSNDTALRIPDDHYSQVQFGMWIGEREWCDYVAYNEDGVPAFVWHIERNDKYIANIEKSCIAFYDEMFDGMTYLREQGWLKETLFNPVKDKE